MTRLQQPGQCNALTRISGAARHHPRGRPKKKKKVKQQPAAALNPLISMPTHCKLHRPRATCGAAATHHLLVRVPWPSEAPALKAPAPAQVLPRLLRNGRVCPPLEGPSQCLPFISALTILNFESIN